MRHGHRLAAAVLAALGAAAPLPAQQRAAGAASTPRFGGVRMESRASIRGLTAAQTRELNADVRRLADVLSANPAVRSPSDSVCTRVFVHMPERLHERQLPSLYVQLFEWWEEPERCGDSDTVVKLSVNDPKELLLGPGPTDGKPLLEDEQGAMWALPRPQPPLGDWARYAGYVVLTKRAEPLVLPVSRERWLRAQVRQVEEGLRRAEADAPPPATPSLERWRREEKPKLEADFRRQLEQLGQTMSAEQLAAVRKQQQATLTTLEEAHRRRAAQAPELASGVEKLLAAQRRRLVALRADLAALPAEERTAPACVGTHAENAGGLVDCADQRAQPVASLNPAFFDPALPRSAVQLLIVRTDVGRGWTETSAKYETRQRVFETLDYDALAAVLR